MKQVEGDVLEAVVIEGELALEHPPEIEDVPALDLEERVVLSVVVGRMALDRILERAELIDELFLGAWKVSERRRISKRTRDKRDLGRGAHLRGRLTSDG